MPAFNRGEHSEYAEDMEYALRLSAVFSVFSAVKLLITWKLNPKLTLKWHILLVIAMTTVGGGSNPPVEKRE